MIRPVLGIGFTFLFMLSFFASRPVYGAENRLDLKLPGGQEVELQRFAGAGESLLLWLPSERGIGKAHEKHASALAEMGHEVWLADLHDAYFVEPNRSSISRFPVDEVVALIDAATRFSDTNVILLTSSRGAQLALIAAREWQLQNPGITRLKGAFLAQAHLYAARPGVGEIARYLPITAATNLPVYLFDAQYSTQSARIGELAKNLGNGGSQVFTQVLQGVQGGFFARDDAGLGEAERAAKKDYAFNIARAVKLLEMTATPATAVASSLETIQFSKNPLHSPALQAIDKSMPAPALQLTDYNGKTYRLDENRNQLILVNFWATWCRPCVEEIPSLHRLREKIQDPTFSIITVNVGENRDRIEKFLKHVPIALLLLLDHEGKVAREWKI